MISRIKAEAPRPGITCILYMHVTHVIKPITSKIFTMKNSLLYAVCFCIAMFGCGDAVQNPDAGYASQIEDTLHENGFRSIAAIENPQDKDHIFVRTADIKFEVADVRKATAKIEDAVIAHGGFITYTGLKSDINRSATTQISEDSAKTVTWYSVTNMITLRIPNTRLDTTLKDIAATVGFLDYRVIRADDVKQQLLANEQKQELLDEHGRRLARDIDVNPKKLRETTIAEQELLDKREAAADAGLMNLSFRDQVKYSTVKMLVYQPETMRQTMFAVEKPVVEWQPGFGAKLFEALKNGWAVAAAIIVLLTNTWVFVLLALLLFFGWKRYSYMVKK